MGRGRKSGQTTGNDNVLSFGDTQSHGKAVSVLNAVAPDMPSDMPEEAKAVWRRVVPELEKINLLVALDADALEAYCRDVAEWRRIQRLAEIEDDPASVKQLQSVVTSLASRIKVTQRNFGLSPEARSKLRIGTQRPIETASDDDDVIDFFGDG